MAGATGLEPATTGSTVRNSNQLSYAPALVSKTRAFINESGDERKHKSQNNQNLALLVD
jgi:hypothetical protein